MGVGGPAGHSGLEAEGLACLALTTIPHLAAPQEQRCLCRWQLSEAWGWAQST